MKDPSVKSTPIHLKLSKKNAPSPNDLKQNEILVEVLLMSLDPAMRGWLNETKSYIAPVRIGEVMRSGGIGRILASNNDKFKKGQLVNGMFGFQNYYIGPANGFAVLPDVDVPYSAFLGPLGATGLTAYFGLLEVGQLKKGEVVVVSGAAGATGSIVGQIAKIYGCTVVGLAGDSAKVEWLKEMGYDKVINYKTSRDLNKDLQDACPRGVDVYFDNVGGPILDSVLRLINRGARVVICGAISQYNKPPAEWYGPKNYITLLTNSARMEGFVIFNYAHKFPEAQLKLGEWLKSGKLKYKEDRVKGLENAPLALNKLFDGSNMGKLLVEVASDERLRSKL